MSGVFGRGLTASTLNNDVFPAFCKPIIVMSISAALLAQNILAYILLAHGPLLTVWMIMNPHEAFVIAQQLTAALTRQRHTRKASKANHTLA